MGRSINLLDGRIYTGDPGPMYRWLRDEAPCYRDEVNGIWGISRYEDIVAIEKNAELYSSVPGSRPRIDQSADNSMINRDDPVHQTQRRLVARQFTPRAVKRLDETIRGHVTELIDAVAPVGSCEAVRALAAPLPARLIAEKLGFGPDLWDKCREWSEVTMFDGGQYALDGSGVVPTDSSVSAAFEFAGELMKIIEQRRVAPADDLVSIWCHQGIDGQLMTDADIIAEGILILDGGAETTRTVIGAIIRELALQPDQRHLLLDGADIAVAVEEFIRWVTPILNMRRTATADHELHGQRIRAGDEILLMYASANRDERVFDDPDTFDVTRSPNHHVAFGFGTHFCLGASLARRELKVMFEELLARIPDWRLAPGADPQIIPAVFARAYDEVPIEFTPA